MRNEQFVVKSEVMNSSYEKCENDTERYSVLFDFVDTFDIRKKEWDKSKHRVVSPHS